MNDWNTNEGIAFVIDDRLAKINDLLFEEHCGWCFDLAEGTTSHTTDAIRMMLEGMGDREIDRIRLCHFANWLNWLLYG